MNSILKNLKIIDKPIINVINKIDKVNNALYIDNLLQETENSVAISAKKGSGLESLLHKIESFLQNTLIHMKFSLSYQEGPLLSLIHRRAHIIRKNFTNNSIDIEAEVDFKLASMLAINRV